MNHLEFNNAKIIDFQNLKRMLAVWRFKEQKIVFTNGCFDILHLGHADYLSKAKALGDKLIVGLNTDQSVSRLKGPGRPVNPHDARAKLLASLSFIDAVVLFDDDTPHQLIQFVQPDVLVKGSDYKPDEIVGADIVLAKGGQIETIDFLEGYSTSSMIKKLRS